VRSPVASIPLWLPSDSSRRWFAGNVSVCQSRLLAQGRSRPGLQDVHRAVSRHQL
jgi:hypothetical protein